MVVSVIISINISNENDLDSLNRLHPQAINIDKYGRRKKYIKESSFKWWIKTKCDINSASLLSFVIQT